MNSDEVTDASKKWSSCSYTYRT